MPIVVQEVNSIIAKLKCRKAPGWDNITAEHLKYSGPICRRILTWILNSVHDTVYMPVHFRKGVIVPIPKSDKDRYSKENYRGITLLPVLYKIYEHILSDRLKVDVEQRGLIHCFQGAAQQGCSSIHSSMLLQETISYNRAKGKTVYVAFLDTRKAFDSVWIDGLLYKLYQKEIDSKFCRIIKGCYHDFSCRVFTGGMYSKWFPVKQGVHQGGPLSMLLYLLFIDDMIRDLCTANIGPMLFDMRVPCVAYADDIAVLDCNKDGLNQLLEIAYHYSKTWNFKFNSDTSALLIFGKDNQEYLMTKLGQMRIKERDKYKHVGIWVTTNGTIQGELEDKLAKGKRRILAARAMGGGQVRIAPTTASKVYWESSIPIITYGLQVTPLKYTEIAKIEKPHQEVSRLIQGLSEQTPACESLRTIGWKSVQAYIDLIRMLFFRKMLCCI